MGCGCILEEEPVGCGYSRARTLSSTYMFPTSPGMAPGRGPQCFVLFLLTFMDYFRI